MPKKIKVLLLFSCPYNNPRGYNYKEEFCDPDNMYTENDVYKALLENNFDVSLLGIHNDVGPLFEEIKENRPDVIFNLVEVFNNNAYYEKNIAALLEMIGIPYTGATSDNIYICNNKALHKKILNFHRIKIPYFHTFYRKHKVWLPKKMRLPLVIKPLCEEASRGISQASIADNKDSFLERVKFIHDNMNLDAIVDEYIDGRELYVTVFGNKRLIVLPPRELIFGELPEDSRIATYKAKWDEKYRSKWGIKSVDVSKLPPEIENDIIDTCKRAYRALNIKSYARFDMRLSNENKIYILEANANPCIAKFDEVAQSAEKFGISYNGLISRIVYMALNR